MNIVAYNPSVEQLEKSMLSKSYAAGVTTLRLKNADRFSDGVPVLIGAPGRERSEIAYVSGSPTATDISLAAATEFPHDADDPVYVLEYDQLKIYRSTTGMNGTYSVLATVDLDVDNRTNETYYDDVNALAGYYYKLAFYNSVEDDESDQTAPIAATGYTAKQLGRIIPEVAKDIGDPDFMEYSIDQYISWLNDINNDLILAAKRPFRFLKTNSNVDIDQDDTSFPFPADLWKVDYIEVNDNSNNVSEAYRPKIVSTTRVKDELGLTALGADYVSAIAVDGAAEEVVFYPKARVQRLGAFTFHYYKFFTEFTSLSDTVETPNTLIYKLGLYRRIYKLKADSDSKYMVQAKDYDSQYGQQRAELQREKNIMADGPTGMAPDRKRYPQWGGRRYRQ